MPLPWVALSFLVGHVLRTRAVNDFRDLTNILVELFSFATDDYANVLLAGETMRPLLDSLFVSREKLAFIVDATAAPIASISPVSSWVGFEIGLIEDEIKRIIDQEGGEENLRIKTSGMVSFCGFQMRHGL